ncbi:MAG: hypothetical protein H0T62_00280 [Parachlamydiaceae bacterium]|nr:hypothetical protein [Parachlamydiaceae bacterium]
MLGIESEEIESKSQSENVSIRKEETNLTSQSETAKTLEAEDEKFSEVEIEPKISPKKYTKQEKIEIFEKKVQVFLENQDSAEAYKQGTSIINKLKCDNELHDTIVEKNPGISEAFSQKYIPIKNECQMNKFMNLAKNKPENGHGSK